MKKGFNFRKIHLVTQHGGHFTPVDDVISAKPEPLTEEYSLAKLGFIAGTQVTAKGPYNGGMTRESYNDIVRECGLIELPNDQLAVNPNMIFEIDKFDPEKDFPPKKDATFLVFSGKGLKWSGEKPLRIEVHTPIEDLLTLFPNTRRSGRNASKMEPNKP